MKSITDIDKFMSSSENNLRKMLEDLEKAPVIEFERISGKDTALFIIDLNNGFAKKGILYSPNVEALVSDSVKLARKFINSNMKVYAFSDRHSSNSPELISYPFHCMAGTEECEIIDELKSIEGIEVIYKNSTNGLFANQLGAIDKIKDIDTFVIIGDCTDICIYQYAVGLKAYLNENNKPGRVIVPMNMVDTFDMEGHNADFLNAVFLSSMISNGVEVVKSII